MSELFCHFFEIPLKPKQGQCRPRRSFPSKRRSANLISAELPRVALLRRARQISGLSVRYTFLPSFLTLEHVLSLALAARLP